MGKEADYRYELKYVLNPKDFNAFEYALLLHPAGFKRSFAERCVNNIYFDSVDFNSCFENLSGISNRVKVRYRWYGKTSDYNNGVIEFKIKENMLGTKKYESISNLENLEKLSEAVNEKLKNNYYKPSLQNKYLRSYWISQKGNYRLTIDRKLCYSLPGKDFDKMDHPHFNDPRVIVEIKFSKDQYANFDSIAGAFPFRISKHSKYVTGLLELVYN